VLSGIFNIVSAPFLCLRPSPNVRGRQPVKKPAEPASKFRAPVARPSPQCSDAQRGRKSSAPVSRNAKVMHHAVIVYSCWTVFNKNVF